MDYAAGSVFMLMGILLLVDSFLLMGCVFLLSAWFLLSKYIHAAGVFMLPIHQFMLLNWFLLIVSNHADGTMYLLPEYSSSVPADYVPAGHVIISADRYSEYADLSYRRN
ncbi:hypothetical protein Tco_0415137 [Tanacetum coccineum]